MKIQKVLSLFVACALAVILINGCATIPPAETLPAYSLNGVNYLSLVSLCQAQGIKLDYDTFSRVAVLTKDNHKINLHVGDTLILVDNQPQYLRHPVDIYQGAMVVPAKFKEQVLDSLFRPPYPGRKAVRLISKKIVLDAGHGGTDPGTIGKSGLQEKDINLDLTQRLAKILRQQGMEVVMTRSGDNFIPLERRVAITNNSRADLFVSIHTNANRVKSLNGFEVYYVSQNVSDIQRALSSAKNSRLNLTSNCFATNSTNLKVTLWDMLYNYNRAESIGMAKSICRVIDSDLDTRLLGIKGAGFYVLKGAQVPAILIEIGFLSNREEERLLSNGNYRQQIAGAIAQGIYNYFEDFATLEASLND